MNVMTEQNGVWSGSGQLHKSGDAATILDNSTSTSEKAMPDTTSSNGHGIIQATKLSDEDTESAPVVMREGMRHLRHAYSEVLPGDKPRRSVTMVEAREYASTRLQEELNIAQSELKLKDDECEKLLKVRDQMGEELEDLTASLFQEANNMVIDANVKRMHSEKLLADANNQIEVLQAEVVALKQLVLTSTPSSPNKHMNPQLDKVNGDKEKKKEKSSKPFWKTHRRSTSHHQFTQEDRLEVAAQHDVRVDRCNEIDPVCFEEFKGWRENPDMSRDSPFIARIAAEDICTCLNFTNTALAENVLTCVENNTLAIEPIPGDNSFPRKCHLSEVQKPCNYKVKLGDASDWYTISQHCRNRIAAVCDFFTYIRYIQQGLVKSDDKGVFYEIVRLRKQMAIARLGYV